MPRLRRVVIPGAIALLVLLGSLGLVGGLVSPEKSFSLPRVGVDAVLAPDGSMRVVEHITYDFHGPFSYGTRPIPVGTYQITGVHVREDGVELPSVGAPYNLQWFFDAEDEQRTFDVEYTVLGASPVGPDVAELYWKWVGERHPEIGQVTATLQVPPGEGSVKAWGHGELTGRVRVDGDTVRWVAPEVPEGSYVEGRVAVPSSRFSVAPSGEPRLDRILAEERSLARAANDAREAAARDAARAAEQRDLANVLAPVLVGLGIVVFAFLSLRFGREPHVTGVGEYVRELPDDPPAIVDTLLHWGSVRPLAFGATVVDLAQRGHLTITEERVVRRFWPDSTEYRFRRAGAAPDDDLTDYEQRVLERLFAAGGETTQSELNAWAAAHTSSAQKFWNGFRASVSKDFDARKYQRSERALVFAANLVTAVVIGAAGALALFVHAWWAGAAAILWAVVQSALTVTLRQRTRTGATRAAEWEGVANFLRDFSELEDAPAGHLVLWERYLVYAVALGVSAELVRGLAMRLPEVAESIGTTRWYVAQPSGSGTPGIAGLGSFGSGFSASFAAASTPRSSGSGGGGGFSGGGGGGGGGGGIGAG